MGRHTTVRDINAAEKAKLALTLRKQGYTLEEIAQQCGYQDKSGAWRAIKRELDRIPGDDAAEVKKLEELRYDALLKVCMEKALRGDMRAVEAAIALADRRAKLHGLDARPDDPHAGGTIVREYGVEVNLV